MKYNGEHKADFYIQSHGNHAGRPLREPIPNCFSVWCDQEHAFEIVYCLYSAKVFEFYIIGSVIPFIRLYEIRTLLNQHFSKSFCSKKLHAVRAADQLEKQLKLQLEKIKQLKYVTANRALKDSQ